MQTIDQETGEIIDGHAPRQLARVENQGSVVPRQSRDASGVIAMLEDGDFNAEVSEKLRDLVRTMEAHAHNNKGIAKGKVNITLDVQVANGIFVLTGDYKVTEPKQKRMGTALFSRDDGGLGKNPAGAYKRLGEADPVADARDAVIDQGPREVRDI